jgi:hypothetical protein
MPKTYLSLPWAIAALFFFTSVYLWRSLIKQSGDAKVVRSKLMVFERIENSLKQGSDSNFTISNGLALTPSPTATPKPTWIDIEFLRHGVNIELFNQLEKKYKDHVGMGYFAFHAKNAGKEGPAVDEIPQYRTDFREKAYPHELTHGISWLMDLSRFVKIKIKSEDHEIVLLTSMLKPDRSRRYYSRTQQIWKYAKRHKYTAAHCFHSELSNTTHFNFSITSSMWKPMCLRGALQKREFAKTDYIVWVDEEVFIRPTYQHIPLKHFTDPVGVAFPIIVQDTGDIPDMRVFFLRNIAAGQRIIYFWILELYMRIWCKMGKCKTDQSMSDMAFCSVYVDELMLRRNVQKLDKASDRLRMKHLLRQVIDSRIGKPYLFFDNFVSFFIESLQKFGVHRRFSEYDHWSPPVKFLGTLEEPTGALGAMKEKKMLGPNEQVDRKAQNPSIWFFATRQGNTSRSFFSTRAKYLKERLINRPDLNTEKKVADIIEARQEAKIAGSSKKNLVDDEEKKTNSPVEKVSDVKTPELPESESEKKVNQ